MQGIQLHLSDFVNYYNLHLLLLWLSNIEEDLSKWLILKYDEGTLYPLDGDVPNWQVLKPSGDFIMLQYYLLGLGFFFKKYI